MSNEANTAAGTAKSALEDGIAAARDRLSGLREELTRLIGEDDERWYAFGFERPGDPETSETPENLTAVPIPGGALFSDWDDARRSDRLPSHHFQRHLRRETPRKPRARQRRKLHRPTRSNPAAHRSNRPQRRRREPSGGAIAHPRVGSHTHRIKGSLGNPV